MPKLTLMLTVGSIAAVLAGFAHAETTLRIANSSSTITIPSSNDIRAESNDGTVRAARNTLRAFSGSWNRALPQRQPRHPRQM
jgi:hypothetical protein